MYNTLKNTLRGRRESSDNAVSSEPRGGRKNEPLGLHVVYDPPGPRTVDIVFVHGLGGTSRLSWSHGRDLANFWPKEWLPLEPGFQDARVLTFGYHAHFLSPTKDLLNISDFAKDLLLQLKTGVDESVAPLDIGEVPVIFVVHSMGGLVVKKAYVLGAQDPQFRHILDAVRGIVFLGTPHRGSDLAEMLNTFLTATFLSPKQYVTDLQRNSARIGDINDQFRLHAEKLDLVSFFETLPTSVGVKKMIIVQPDSAVTGYPHELSAPLKADHHHVCKFVSRGDANYVSVRNVIRLLIEKSKVPTRPRPLPHPSVDDDDSLRSFPSTDELRTRLRVEPPPTDTLLAVMEQYVPGCCDWVVSSPEFVSFMADTTLQPNMLHITGGPGTGKTVLASFLVQHLDGLGFPAQFWYFRYDRARSNRQCLMSLAFQILAALPAYAHKLLARRAADLDSIARSDLRSLWQKLFLDILGTLEAPPEPLYWVVDALDESESAQVFLQLLASLNSMRFPLRVILLTRTHTVTKHFVRLKTALPAGRVSQLALATPAASLQLFIDDKMDGVPWDDEELKAQIARDLLRKAEGSFLWLSLVMRDLASCDTAQQVMDTLREIPPELTAVYERLARMVARDLDAADAPLATAILSWVACAERPLDDAELREALGPKFPLLSVRHTVSRLCGDLVAVDSKGRVAMVHDTAREFVLSGAASPLHVRTKDAHALILDKCLATLTHPRFKLRLKSQGCTGLLRYCCLSWAHHLARSDGLGGPRQAYYVRTVKGLFAGPAVLAWIEAVATSGQLQVLTAASRALLLFAETLRQAAVHEDPVARVLDDIEYLSAWAAELVRVVGKFGTHLLQYPPAVYVLVPLFCPPDSVIGRQFASPSSPSFSSATLPSVTGIANTAWDDSLAKFTLGPDQEPEAIYALDSLFGILTSDKSVNLYDADTFQELHRFRHGETIVAAHFSRPGTLLVTCGIRTVKVWNTASGRLLHTFANPLGKRGRFAVAVAFSHDASEIILFCVDSTNRRRRLADTADPEYDASMPAEGEGEEGWVRVDFYTPSESASLRRAAGAPNCVAFSPDGSKIAVAYRVSEMTVWDTETGNRIGRRESPGGYKITRTEKTDYYDKLAWNPVTGHVLGISSNGTVFKWDPNERLAEEMEQQAGVLATALACSADGRLIVTAQRDGSLKVFSFDSFALLFDLASMVRPTAMAFSPDGRRIYDLRRSFCNVWQPSALIRVAEQDERGGDPASAHHCDGAVAGPPASEASAVLLEPVTAVAADPASAAYAFGNDGGVVRYVASGSDPHPGAGVDVACGLLGVTCLAFSSDGRAFAAASVDGKVAVRKLRGDHSLDASCSFALELEAVRSSVLQTVLDARGELLLVHTRDSTRVWDVDTQSLLALQASDGESCRWLAHPTRRRAFVSVRPSAIACFYPGGGNAASGPSSSAWHIDWQRLDSVDWSGVAPLLSRKLRQDLDIARTGGAAAAADLAVHRVFAMPGLTDLLLQMSGPGAAPDQREMRFVLVDVSFLSDSRQSAGAGEDAGADTDADDARRYLRPRALPASVLKLIEIPLGFMAETANQARRASSSANSAVGAGGAGAAPVCAALAFIDRDFWVRTWSLDDAEGRDCRRHFFLPRDWVNMDCLHLAAVTADGRLLCPRNGEVAVVHNALWGTLGVDGQ